MENTGSFYDDVRKGNTAQGYEETTPQAQNTQDEVSGTSQWTRRILATLATSGGVLIIILILDATFNNSKIIEWIMIGK